jgi:hypothetical protein
MNDVIEVELPDGNVAEFPANWDESRIQTAVLDYLQNVGQRPVDVPLPSYAPEGFEVVQPTAELDRSGWEEFQRDVPALVGGIAAPLIASRLPGVQQMGQAAQRAIQVGASGIGGAIGEAGQMAKEYIMGEEEAPETIAEAGKRAAYAGGEQAVFEGIGQLALKTAGYVGQAIKPKVTDLSRALSKKFTGEGGQFTAAQLSDSWWIQQLDALTKGSITASGVYKGVDVANVEAYKSMEKNLIKTIAKKASTDLSDDALGQLFRNNIKGGRSAHSSAASVMYENVDNLLDASGGAAISTSYLKQIAGDTLEQLKRVANVGSGEVDMQLLKQVTNLPDNLTFKDAHFLRSSLLAMQRDLEGVVGAGRANRTIGDIVTSINGSMEKSALNAGKDVADAYLKTNKFWRKGKEIFDNKFIANLINANKKNPERIGETIFRDGNVTEIIKAKKALRSAAKLSKEIEFDTAWHGMQAGYLQSLLTKTSDAEGVVAANRLLKTFVDRKKGRTLNAAFSKDQRNRIIEFAMIGERLQKRPEAGLGMVMNLVQAGTIGAGMAFKIIDPVEAGVILVAPRVVAHALTNPKITALMAKSMKTEYKSTLGKQLATKLSAEIIKIQNNLGLQEQVEQ